MLSSSTHRLMGASEHTILEFQPQTHLFFSQIIVLDGFYKISFGLDPMRMCPYTQ